MSNLIKILIIFINICFIHSLFNETNADLNNECLNNNFSIITTSNTNSTQKMIKTNNISENVTGFIFFLMKLYLAWVIYATILILFIIICIGGP